VTSKKTQKDLKKRTLSLTDKSLEEVDLTVWGEDADFYDNDKLGGFPVIAVKNCRVGEFFGGLSLNTTFGSPLIIQPDIPEAHVLRHWWDSEGKDRETKSISKTGGGSADDPRKYLRQIATENLGSRNKDKAFYFVARATITYFRASDPKKPPWYPACKQCNKKVGEMGTCAEGHTNGAQTRYILSMLICDVTGSTWVTAFNDHAEKLLNVSATTAEQTLNDQSQGEAAYSKIFTDANFKTYVFKLRVKRDDFNQMDEVRDRCHIVSADPVDFVKEGQFLLNEIANLESS